MPPGAARCPENVYHKELPLSSPAGAGEDAEQASANDAKERAV
jgi:hypothetical protein